MNEVIKALLERRSIRKYKTEPVPEADRDLIVQAGLYAPSSKNTQAWHLTVVESPEIIANITMELKAALLRAGVEKYRAMAENDKYTVNYGGAPLFIVVSANPEGTPCPAEDCATVLENMFVAAYSLGVGSCWINQLCPVSDEPGFRSFITGLGVPESNKIYGAGCFGYADGSHPKAPVRKENTVNIIK